MARLVGSGSTCWFAPSESWECGPRDVAQRVGPGSTCWAFCPSHEKFQRRDVARLVGSGSACRDLLTGGPIAEANHEEVEAVALPHLSREVQYAEATCAGLSQA